MQKNLCHSDVLTSVFRCCYLWILLSWSWGECNLTMTRDKEKQRANKKGCISSCLSAFWLSHSNSSRLIHYKSTTDCDIFAKSILCFKKLNWMKLQVVVPFWWRQLCSHCSALPITFVSACRPTCLLGETVHRSSHRHLGPAQSQGNFVQHDKAKEN